MGNSLANDKSINAAIASTAHQYQNKSKLGKPIQLLVDCIRESLREVEVLFPNNLFTTNFKFEQVSLGPVRIVKLSKLVNELNSKVDKIDGATLSIEDNRAIVKYNNLPHESVLSNEYMWAVKTSSPKESREDEAKWLVFVACSCLRMFSGQWKGVVPLLGDVEPNPMIQHDESWKSPSVSSNKNFGTGGSKLIFRYDVSKSNVNFIRKKKYQSLINAIFDGNENSLALRVQNSLGWQAKARQCADLSERLILFFTSIEALLSPKKKQFTSDRDDCSILRSNVV